MLGGIIVKHYCKYHPGTEALWYCSHDGLHLCQQCVESREGSLTEARCLLCNQELHSTAQGQGGPLWRQLDRYLRYPFAPLLLPVLLVWALLAALVPPLPVMVPVALLGGLPAWGFGRAVMALRSHPGKARKIAVPGWDCLSDMAGWRAAMLQALPALMVMVPAGFMLVWVSVSAGLLIGALGLFLVPAFWLAIQVQGGLALACLCGDILARHGRLWGLDQGVRKVSAPLEERRQWVQLCAGRFDKVLLSTGKSLTHKGATVADWQRYDRLLEITGREDERRSQAPAYLEKIVLASAWSEALVLLSREREITPGWLPASPSLRLALARGIHEQAPKMAVALLKDLHDRHRAAPADERSQ